MRECKDLDSKNRLYLQVDPYSVEVYRNACAYYVFESKPTNTRCHSSNVAVTILHHFLLLLPKRFFRLGFRTEDKSRRSFYIYILAPHGYTLSQFQVYRTTGG